MRQAVALAYDDALAARVRDELAGEEGLTERRMFGGLAFLVHGHMAVVVSGRDGLMLRCPPEETDTLLAEPGAGPMVMRGKELRGWLRVEPDALDDDDALARWVAVGRDHARTLPPK